jgi:hypothetical protein
LRKKVLNKMETISIDDKKAILRKYKLRTAGAQGATIEITLPKEAVEREARNLGISEEEAVEKLVGVWRYNGFRGLHLVFELKKGASRSAHVKAETAKERES